MKSKKSHNGLILFIVVASICISFIPVFADTTTFTYDDINRVIKVERGTKDTLTPPVEPSGLSASAVSSTQINLSWTDNSTNESGFKIERKTGAGGAYSQIAIMGANITTYSDTGLTAGTTYYYKVRAYNAAGDSLFSNEAYATTAVSCSVPAVMIARATPVFYSSLQAAYNAAVSGDIIQSRAITFTENLSINKNISVTFQGGYDCYYTTNSGAVTVLKGMIQTFAGGGTITIGNFTLTQ